MIEHFMMTGLTSSGDIRSCGMIFALCPCSNSSRCMPYDEDLESLEGDRRKETGQIGSRLKLRPKLLPLSLVPYKDTIYASRLLLQPTSKTTSKSAHHARCRFQEAQIQRRQAEEEEAFPPRSRRPGRGARRDGCCRPAGCASLPSSYYSITTNTDVSRMGISGGRDGDQWAELCYPPYRTAYLSRRMSPPPS